VHRSAWAAAGAAGVAGAVAAGVVVLGGGSPAYAVTPNADGTVTVALKQLAAIPAANIKLRAYGIRAVLVPVRPGCPSMPPPPAGSHPQSARGSATGSGNGMSITLDVRGAPAGEIAVVAASSVHGQVQLATQLTKGPVPSCVSLPPPPSGGGAGGAHRPGQPRQGAGITGSSR
jgi:hypothetical protein